MKNFLSLILIACISALLLTIGFWEKYAVLGSFLGFACMWQAEKHFRYFFEQRKIRIWFFWAIFLFFWNVFATWWVRITGALWVISIANTLVMLVPISFWLWTRKRLPPIYQILFFVVLWLSFEFLHHRWQLTWIWLTLGNLFLYQNTWVQWYEYTGVLGGSLWILLGNLLVFQAFQKPTPRTFAYLSMSLLVPIIISYIILWQYQPEAKGSLEVVLIQPNINPFTEKFVESPNFIPHAEQTKILLDLSKKALSSRTDLLVFPETALDENFDERYIKKYENIKRLDTFYQKHQVPILFGATTQQFSAYQTSATSQFVQNINSFYEDFNVAYLMQKDSLTIYRKMILVPGVETIPFPRYTIFLKDFISNIGAQFFLLGIGKEQTIFKVKKARIAPVICYESMYGEFVGEFVQKGANLLCTITNDGWLGNTDWQQHHLYLGALRSIETRRTMLHCSNMGASGVISTKGEILKEVGYNQRTALSFAEVGLHENQTFYVRFGDYLGRLALLMSFLGMIYCIIRRQKL